MVWLKAGVLNDDVFEETRAGTPQGRLRRPRWPTSRCTESKSPLGTRGRRRRPLVPSGASRRQVDVSPGQKRNWNELASGDPICGRPGGDARRQRRAHPLQRGAATLTKDDGAGAEEGEDQDAGTHTFLRTQNEDGQAGFDFLGFTIATTPRKQFPTP